MRWTDFDNPFYDRLPWTVDDRKQFTYETFRAYGFRIKDHEEWDEYCKFLESSRWFMTDREIEKALGKRLFEKIKFREARERWAAKRASKEENEDEH